MDILIFWISVSIIAYAYIGYPVLLTLLSLVRKNLVRKEIFMPKVSLIISIYNREDIIRHKLSNSLTLDYLAENLEVIVASDGSTDGTNNIVKEFDNVILYAEERKGKVAALNNVVPKASGEIIVFSDANSIYEPNTIKNLMRNFHDQTVGCVSGSIRYYSRRGELIESLYQRYEEFIKEKETTIGSIVGANGGLYAIRKNLYTAIPPHFFNDAYHPPQIVSRGYRAVYEKEAIAVEELEGGMLKDYRRKKRIATHGLYQTSEVLRMIWDRPLYLLQYITKILLRRLIPIILLVLLLVNTFIKGSFYQSIFILQIIFYTFGILGLFMRDCRIFKLPAYFITVHGAILIGLIKYMWGEKKTTWDRNG